MDNYFKYDPEYSALDDAGKKEFVAKYNMNKGGRVGFQGGGISEGTAYGGGVSMSNTLAENIRRNRAQAVTNQGVLAAARNRLPTGLYNNLMSGVGNRAAHEALDQSTGGARGVAATVTGPPTADDISAAIAANQRLAAALPQRPADLPPTLLDLNKPRSGMPSIQDLDRNRNEWLAQQEQRKPSLQERMGGESWETLSDNDQYRISQEYPGQTPARRNPDFVPNMNQGGRVGLHGGGAGIEGLEDRLQTDAPDITYEGDMRMASDILGDESGDIANDLWGRMSNEERREWGNIENYMKSDDFQIILINLQTKKQGARPTMAAKGGRIGYRFGLGPVAQGLPGIPRMAPDGMEYDMSQNGGFQALGAKEGKDDVKANLAKNEFVFTADAVRGAGNGDIELGAQKMYDTMKNLERRVVG